MLMVGSWICASWGSNKLLLLKSRDINGKYIKHVPVTIMNGSAQSNYNGKSVFVPSDTLEKNTHLPNSG